MKSKPNKAGLVWLLRSRGEDIPSIQGASFAPLWESMALSWADRAGRTHTAYLYLCMAQPVLQVGRRTEPVTAEELECFGLVEKKEAPGPADAEAEGHHENTIMIPQFAELCKG